MRILNSILFCIFFLKVVLSTSSSNISQYTVYYADDDTYVVKPGLDYRGVAFASYSNQMMTTGWGYLSLTTSQGYPDAIQAAGAGYLEGYITQEMIYQNWENMYQNEYHNTVGDDVEQWIEENIEYLVNQIASNQESPYWTHTNLLMQQLIYMQRGYNQSVVDNRINTNQLLGIIPFFLMNMDGDMIDLGPALNLSKGNEQQTPANAPNPKAAFHEFMRRTGHCSALIKLTDDLSDLYSGHTTWSSYYEMVRLFKSYTFNYATPAASKTTMFSSYPATLSSIDDFYLLDSNIVVIETTNGLMNNNLYPLITPSSVLSWMRVVVTNRIAADGKSWCETFALYNSGTYNNQWIIVDYNKFIKGQSVLDGTLYILEQIPGYVEYSDVTPILRTGYWPSYNVPFYENIYDVSGFNETYAQFGSWFSYEGSPRALIFRRDANNVKSLSDFQNILRYNNWQNDPFSAGNAGNQISSRFDLVTQDDPNNQYLDPDAFGGIDSKVVSSEMVKQLLVNAQSGPSHDNETPFTWDSKWNAKYTFSGQPTLWNFDWMTMSTSSMTPASSSSTD